MTDMKILKELMGHVVNKTAPANFDNSVNLREVLLAEMNKFCGNRYEWERNKLAVYEILSQTLTEMVPKKVDSVIGMFADTIQVPENTKVSFRIKKGHQRAKQFITRATPSGVYETFRLDRESVTLEPRAYGGAGIIDFERYLANLEDIMDVYDVLLEGLTDAVFKEIMTALMASWDDTGRPSNNRVWANTFIESEMTKLVNVVAAYGDPVIYTTREFASQMVNAIEYNGKVKISDEDMIDIRRQGYIGTFRGTPVVALPQSYEDENNEKLSFNPRFAFVIPRGNENIVKVAFEGDTYVDEWKNRDRSTEIQGYRKFAVGIVGTPNYWSMYYNAGIDAGGWEPIPNPNSNP